MIPLHPPGLWRLWGAALLDALIGLFAWLLGAMWLVIVVWGFRASPLELSSALVLGLAILLLGVVLHLVYHVLLIGGCGQTLGKMALGVVVVKRDGSRAGYGRALVRCLGGWLSALTLGLANLGVLFTRERRALGDVLAGTRVIGVP